MAKSKVKWIRRAIIVSPYCIGLCKEEAAFWQELKRLKIPRETWPEWIPEGKDARVHLFTQIKSHNLCAIVCIKKSKKTTQNQIVGLLIHEAVHIWQEIKKEINEHEPSQEFEAYSIQAIAQSLIEAYK